MTSKKRIFPPTFKLKVATDALSHIGTLAELASRYQIDPTQVRRWKNQLCDKSDLVFNGPKIPKEIQERESLIEELYKQIGKQKVEIDWMKKKFEQLPP